MVDNDLSQISITEFYLENTDPLWTDRLPEIDIKDDDLLHDTYSNSDTIDISLRQPIQQMAVPIEFPISAQGPPSRYCFTGQYNFQVEIHSSDTHKKKYLYSSKLDRLYVDASCDFPINFKWDGGPKPMLVRACAVFMDPDQAEKQVETCPNHDIARSQPHHDNTVQFRTKWKNVLHSTRSDATDGVYYCGGKDTWYSTVVKFDGLTEKKYHAYRFVCKNSCPMGINRRPLGIIFTLEDLLGSVQGRVQVGVRVCACPRRDMFKDERDAATAPPAAPPPRKRPRGEARGETRGDTDDDRLLTLPALKVRGVGTAILGLEAMVNMMELHRRKTSDQNMNSETETLIQDIKALINKLNTSK